MQQRISAARGVRGSIRLPGDKSISHRYAILAALAGGASRIRNYADGADCRSTLGALRALGIEAEGRDELVIRGRGLDGLRAPAADLDAGNSGSTMRMLSGILAAQPFTSRIGGDESLSRRPMDRIMAPLGRMGASITARDGKYPPLEIRGARLRPIDYPLPVPSAQVKTCVLLAGLYCEGATTVRESIPSRNHTEVALREFGAALHVSGGVITLQGRPALRPLELDVPADLSSAAFFLVAALLLPDSELRLEGVGLNATRAGLVDFLCSMGAGIRVENRREQHGEPAGDLLVRGGPVRGGTIQGELTAQLIDEIPVLAVLGAASREGLVVRNAAELRIKETDRIAAVAENLRRAGVEADVFPDGMAIPGGQPFRAGCFDSFGDHRIAMAFSVAALAAPGESVIENAEAASVSFPGFFDTLRRVAR
ncbi:MAG: 3-phosphoshikimate 1-carboxyvinyltransferase [Bryobacterales bacterium]|nr:3-phosphoshikimate 1-carboxyvinyltransferase [Bryobacterales bacterium]